MKQLSGVGVPTRKTQGALGDIYTDTKTGKEYRCIFAYRDDTDGDFDCQWAEVKGKNTTAPVEKKEPVKEVKVEGPAPEVSDEPVEEPNAETPEQPKKNYTSYSKYNKPNA